jgi:hypothetical protein
MQSAIGAAAEPTGYRGFITDGDALDMEVHRFRILYNTIRPHHALGDQIPKAACLQLDRAENAR